MPSLNIIHHRQRYETDCLAACVQMVLDNLGVNVGYRRLLRLLRTGEDGTSFYNLRFLDTLKVSVLIEDGHMGILESYLAQGYPFLVSVNTADLPYWSEATDHAVVVTGIADDMVWLHDPWFEHAPISVDRVKFESAWLRHEYLYAVINKP